MKNLLLFICCSCYSFLFAQNTDSAQYYFKKGITEKDQRLYAIAEKDFDKAINFNPQYTQAYIESGNVNLEMRRVDAAQGNFVKAYQLEPTNQDVIKQLSDLYFNNHEFQKAIDLVQKCNACDNADRILGMSNYSLEDYAKAEMYLQKAVAENDKDAESAYTLGRTYIELEKEKNAIPLYEKAIAIEPDRSNWIYELGLIYYNQEDYKSALKYFTLAADKDYAKTSDYNENLGFAELYTGDITDGMKTLNDLLAKRPNNTELINNIAYTMYETKHYDEAFTYYQKMLNINPQDASSLYMIGMVFQKKGETAKGQKICDKAIQMDPSLARNRQKKEVPMGL